MAGELIVLLYGRKIGRVEMNRNGRLFFTYDRNWRAREDAVPLSVSMPLAVAEHQHKIIEAYMWGLLPDNEATLNRWGSRFQVSARNPFALMTYVGEDCAGAAQFVRSERVDACVEGASGSVEWLDDADVEQRLRMLRADHSAWRLGRDTGQFSLAGAQPKTALLLEDGKWGVPSGRTPTTHILKPPTGEFDGYAENEHFCLGLARRMGIPTASSSVMHFGNEIAIVIERYDRQRTRSGLVRVHQEDFCQAMGVPPMRKYENEGGPGAKDMVELLRTHSGERQEDVMTFLDALAFNWLVGGTDAHAKNYSLLLDVGGRVRLAPLYDLASALPYSDLEYQTLKLAMRVGKKYRLRDIRGTDWVRLAKEVRTDADALLARIADHAARLPDEAASVAAGMKGEGLTHDVVDRLVAQIAAHAPQYKRFAEQAIDKE